MRKKAAVIFCLVAFCYALALLSGFYFPVKPVYLGAVLTRVLNGKVRPLVVSRNFNETICYVTDRKEGPRVGDNGTYIGEYAGRVSYGLITVQVPHDRAVGSPLTSAVIRKVEPISSEDFVKLLQDQSAKPIAIWIHGYKALFDDDTLYCAQIASDLNMEASVLDFD